MYSVRWEAVMTNTNIYTHGIIQTNYASMARHQYKNRWLSGSPETRLRSTVEERLTGYPSNRVIRVEITRVLFNARVDPSMLCLKFI